jgi:hypothetical protein
VQGLQTGELRREAAGAGGVDDQHRPAPELRQGHWLAIDLQSFKIVCGHVFNLPSESALILVAKDRAVKQARQHRPDEGFEAKNPFLLSLNPVRGLKAGKTPL